MLIVGSLGIGKRAFALALAKRLLCESPSGEFVCDVCSACRWFTGGNHPDFRWIVSEAEAEAETESEPAEGKKKASQQIRIDQIRELGDFVYLGGHRGQARVIIIDPAEAMTPEAANSLLKMLEEPPESVHFLLISSHWRRLLPTIRSRCRLLTLPRPASSTATAWLEAQGVGAGTVTLLPLMGGAPLLALAEVERTKIWTDLMESLSHPGNDPIALAMRWESGLKEGQSMENLIVLIQKKVFDLVCLRMGGRSRFMAMPDKGGGIMGLMRCYDELLRMRALVSHPLNVKLFLEDIAARYIGAYS